jgi:serine/threonine-protein kinase
MTDLSGQSFGRYHLLEQLGEGGMAIVYKAYDTRLETEVAVKVIRTENLTLGTMERSLKRFEREAKSLARLTHPNIVKVTDYGEYEGSPYLVMPYLPGGTLKQRLGKPIPWQEAARLLLPIARALDFAHRQNMIHRDVKSSNILITADGEPMLTDFGIAKVLDLEETADLTGTGMGIGTPEYMAPEQWTGGTTAQSDQYSLGVVFYEMLTGRRPYTADTPAAILLKQANDPLPRPSQFARGLPDKVEKLILKAMAKNPADRFASMGAFASALESLLSGQTAPAVPAKPQLAPKREQTKTAREQLVEEKTMRATPSLPFGGETNRSSSLLRYWPIALAGVFVVLVLALVLNFPKPEQPAPTEAPTEPVAPTAVELPTFTMLAPTTIELPTVATTPIVVSLPEQITDPKGVTMRLVPAGTFKMGSDNGNADEKPVHDVYLDSYYMDVYKVTNKLYTACVMAHVCAPPQNAGRYADSKYENHPVVYVDWNMAKTYCEWRGGNLPTEAQWEKAARGTDGRTYPWGEGIDTTRANYGGHVGDTTAVGSYQSGVSPYGLYNMAGNVWEWVMDWYLDTYYQNSPSENPLGPDTGTYRVLRGGSLVDYDYMVRSSFRMVWGRPSDSGANIGFRCARSQ